jgi:hypothetical protein
MRPETRHIAAVAGLAAALAACNHTPVEGLEKSFSLSVAVGTGQEEPVKIDFLWVIDNSTSMCQEQYSLTKSFSAFTESLGRFFEIDPHVAVATLTADCAPDNTSMVIPRGVFNTVPSREYPPACFEERRMECGTTDAPTCGDIDCDEYGVCNASPTEWVCRKVNQPDICTENPNGSINSACQRTCRDDADCQAFYDDPTFRCRQPAGQARGCLRPPLTEGCPDSLPPILTKDNLDLFRCNASVGVTQSNCLKYEQQLRSGLLAVDPSGPNREQAKAFLREDAYLVIIFVTDEEDCSVADGRYIAEDGDYSRCGLLKTTDDNGPLTPVAHFVNRFKSLKSDPGRVIVAAIAGDSTRGTPEERQLDREAYIASKSHPRTCYNSTSICSSVNGVADYAPRMIELVTSFGPNGVFSNICSDEGIGPALTEIAATIIKVINKVCLPRPILGGLVVQRTSGDGETVTLEEGDGPGKYRVVFGSEDCGGEDGLLPAIAFGDPPQPGDVIKVTYQGDPQLD